MSPINILGILGLVFVSIILIRERAQAQKNQVREKIRLEILRSLHRRDYLI